MEQRSFYAVVPANVRYDDDLSPNAKLLYGEITALCNERGYCWAGNSYFSELYKKDKSTVARWIKQLEQKGYITREVIYKEGSKEIEARHMRICHDPMGEIATTPTSKNKRDNTTSYNTTTNIKSLYDFWNENKIIQHRKMTSSMKSHANARLEDYSLEELQKAISNYKEVLDGEEYYWTHKWTFDVFMKPSNVVRFLDEAEPFSNFASNKKKQSYQQKTDDEEYASEVSIDDELDAAF